MDHFSQIHHIDTWTFCAGRKAMDQVRAGPADMKTIRRTPFLSKWQGFLEIDILQHKNQRMVCNLLKNDQKWPCWFTLLSYHSRNSHYFSPEQVGKQTAGRGEWLCSHCPSEPINVLGSQGTTCAAPLLSILHLTEKEIRGISHNWLLWLYRINYVLSLNDFSTHRQALFLPNLSFLPKLRCFQPLFQTQRLEQDRMVSAQLLDWGLQWESLSKAAVFPIFAMLSISN